jgi:hypothetical protein
MCSQHSIWPHDELKRQPAVDKAMMLTHVFGSRSLSA